MVSRGLDVFIQLACAPSPRKEEEGVGERLKCPPVSIELADGCRILRKETTDSWSQPSDCIYPSLRAWVGNGNASGCVDTQVRGGF